MTHPLAVGVIGAGAVTSTVHLPILSRRRDLFRVTGLTDLHEDAVASLGNRFGIPDTAQFPSVEAMLASADVDAVLVLNSGSHADYVVAALNSGKHVMCEKPLAYTQREIAQIRQALTQSGKQLMVGYMKTHDPAVRRAAELAAADGPLHTIDVLVLHPSGDSQLATSEISVERPVPSDELVAAFRQTRESIQREALGPLAEQIGDLYSEIILGSLIHEFSVLRALGVHIDSIQYVDRWPNTQSSSLVVHALSTEGARITMRWLYLDRFPEYQEEVRWISETASHHLLFPSPYFLRVPTRLTSMRSHGETKESLISTNYHGAFETELVDFHTAVTTGRRIGSTIDDAQEDLLTGLKIARAIADSEGLPYGGDLTSLG